MTIIDDALLLAFRLVGRCSWCGRAGPVDPHHLWARGSGGGSRIDAPFNLVSLCREDHRNVHAGAITLNDLLVVVAQRERLLQDHIREVIFFLRRTPNRTSPTQLEVGLGRLSPGAQAIARGILA